MDPVLQICIQLISLTIMVFVAVAFCSLCRTCVVTYITHNSVGRSLAYGQNRALKEDRGNWLPPTHVAWFVAGRLGRAGGWQGPAQMVKLSPEAVEMLLCWSVISCWAQRYQNHAASAPCAPWYKPALWLDSFREQSELKGEDNRGAWQLPRLSHGDACFTSCHWRYS